MANATAAVLGVGIEALGYLSSKRSAELFDADLAAQVVKKMHHLDFAGFVYDIWHKYTFESSEERRRYLKKFLASEASKKDNHFENFSKIEYILQNASLRALALLKAFHTKEVCDRRETYEGKPMGFFSGSTLLVQALHDVGLQMHEQDIEYSLNELAHYNLIAAMHGRTNGTLYNYAKLGFILLEYIEDAD